MNHSHLSIASTRILSCCHIFLITISNILVQYPIELLGFHTTWGAFTYPAIFILTDLTTRISSATTARNIIFRSMIPGLVISYSVASYLETQNWNDFFVLHLMPLRIAFACFIAYVVGQLLDIFVFQRYRANSSWWLAPTLSTTVGNFIDTILFFAIAFYHSSNPFLNQHWPEIAVIDIIFKILISLIAFVPLYGLILNLFRIVYLNKKIA
ncbi:7-cyano-7-deazaguanine/7-aminomethyl-7-deazaguanine transporter [Legionella bononiensis]|uniref:Probable queuosine precursor transporter n=1 Tax=Legionella bononiensis TaxID=2793102 RepID=A0ABS1WB95_9GAMM|nr:7-cyano-7-deazaguanine/7-aminomethyl-7-deazaguanine transporter [Legionella bononiensis]MBL7481513.1 7-cyano-7-deazaguanine/7-aminomethyl-7-deazaguanine transporter [Legionella bononiensis]MBL7526619.1 7-cyano-7-deazaguanine/7-aminomethyl-7-deazaguanine transporter [Legionella bononiensis]